MRVSKVAVTGGITTTEKYLYEGTDVILTVNASNTQTARNVWGINLISRDGGTKVFMLYNGHKDVTALVDETGVIVGTYYYDAFGVVTSKTGSNDNPYGYSGYEYDEETGLYYLKARFYDPVTARFLQEDSYTGNAADPLSLNLYTYCSNNPIVYWDPTGNIMAGDEYYDAATQAEIRVYTDNYYLATTDKDRDYWYRQAQNARANGTKYDDVSHSTPLFNDFTDALEDSINYNPDKTTFINSATWFNNTNMDTSKGNDYGAWVGISSFFSHGYNSDASEFNKMLPGLAPSNQQTGMPLTENVYAGLVDNRNGSGKLTSKDELYALANKLGLKGTDKEINIRLNQLGYNTMFNITYEDKYGKTDDQINELSNIVDRFTEENQSVDVIGHSRGGLVSIGYAAYNANKVNTVITIDTPYLRNGMASLMDSIKEGQPASTELGWNNSEIEKIQNKWNEGAYKKVNAYAISSKMIINVSGGGLINSSSDGVVTVESQQGGNFKGITPIGFEGVGYDYSHLGVTKNKSIISKVAQLIAAR